MSTLEPWLAPPPEPRQKNSTWHRAISLPADDRVSRCVSSLCSWFYGVLWPYGPGSRSARMHETRPRRPEVGIGARDALVEPGAHVRQASVGVPARRGPVCSVLGVELEGRPVPEGLSNACCRARSARSTESSRWVPAAAQPGGGSRRYEHQRTGLWFGRPGDVAPAVDAAPSGSFSTTLVSRMVPSHRHGVYGGLAIRTVHRSQDLVRRRSANTRPAESPQACDRHHKASDVRAEPSNA